MSFAQSATARQFKPRSTCRALAHGAIGCAVLGLLINTWVVEGLMAPVVVASGSMAPALAGPHVVFDCSQCGHEFSCGVESLPASGRSAECPLCHAATDAELGMTRTGDRVLIDRAAYALHAPERFDVVIARAPDEPQSLCVKRVVGLPGERVSIEQGEIWIDGRIVRKTLTQQRAMAVAVSSAPTEWQDPSGNWQSTGDRFVHAASGRSAAIHWLSYHPRDTILDESPYDQSESRVLNPVSDIILRAQMTTDGVGELLLLATAGRDEFVARLNLGSQRGTLGHNGQCVATFELANSLDRPTRLEWVLADRQVRLALDNCVMLEYRYQPATGDVEEKAPSVAIGTGGAGVKLRSPQVLRDVYYLSEKQNGSWQLGANEYFLLGDNSSHSSDSRSWSSGNGVSGGLIVGKAIWW